MKNVSELFREVSEHISSFAVHYSSVDTGVWALLTNRYSPTSPTDRSLFVQSVGGLPVCFIKDFSVSIQHTAEAGNVLWAVISAYVLVGSENK